MGKNDRKDKNREKWEGESYERIEPYTTKIHCYMWYGM